MFAHLDDPDPYTPPPGQRAAVIGRVRRRRRRRVAVAGGVASVAALGIGAVTAVRARLEPQRIEVGGLAADDGAGAVAAGDTEPADPTDPGDPVTILVVGVDGGHEVDGGDGVPYDEVAYSDTIALVRIDPGAGELRLLSVPRELVLGTDAGEMRANEAFATGGPSRLIRALDATLGTPIDHYVEVDFAGARELVDALGGIRIAVDRPVRDDQTGLALAAGCHTLDGTTTLALGRSRFVEVQQEDGSWVRDPHATPGRDVRGVGVAAALLQAAGRVGIDDLPALVRTGLQSITVDADLATDDLERWARDARDDLFVPLGLPLTDDVVGGGRVLRLLPEEAGAVLDAFSDGGSDPIPITVGGTPVLETNGLGPC